MFRALVFGAVAAGCCAGLIVSVFQWAFVTPLILEAEIFESGVTISGHGDGGDNITRTALTSLASVVYASGLALILLGAMVLAKVEVNMRSALLWGLGGFFAVALAPALGLPPVVPGIPEAPIVDRQIWWVGTAVATALGLWAIFRLKAPMWIALGIALILAPHLVGAPRPESFETAVPAALAAQFVSASLAASALLWVLVSAFSGFAYDRLSAAVE